MSTKHMNHVFCLESHHRNVLLQGYPIYYFIFISLYLLRDLMVSCNIFVSVLT